MDVEKTIQGILESRAVDEERHRRWRVQFEAEQAAIKARQDKFDKDMEFLRHAQLEQLETVNRLVDVAHSHDQKLQLLSDKHDARWAEIGEKLDALIVIVDGMIRGKQ